MPATGSLPVWFRVTVTSLQVAGTLIAVWLNCMASLPSITSAHSSARTGVAREPRSSRVNTFFITFSFD